ncbi:MAG: YdeI/OmpD-associated family protein [Phycisphaerales bacterium]|nr:YdeI/OmpD-associated family protein [Phycisphaerales bacterium]
MPKYADHDAYIAAAPEFAQPILTKLRALMHKACPGVTESIKWNVPWFEHRGLLMGMASFKNHASFGFWRSKEMDDPHGLFEGERGGSMCTIKFSSVKDMPADRVLIAYFKQAARLNETSKPPAPKKRSKSDLKVPASITNALKASKKAKATWDAFPYSHQLEYIIWINDAKKEETRERRLKQMIEMLEAGKSRNWKYDPRENTGHASNKKSSAKPAKKTTKKAPAKQPAKAGRNKAEAGASSKRSTSRMPQSKP